MKVLVIGIALLFLGSNITTLTSTGINQSQRMDSTHKKESQGYYISLNGTLGQNGWYVSKVRVTITGLQGNEIVQYSLDNGKWESYNEPFLVKEGNHSITAIVNNKNGNLTLLNPVLFKVDYTPPYLVMNVDWLFLKLRYDAYTQDNISGIDRVEFWIGPFLQYTHKFTDPSGSQYTYWILSPIPHINITVMEKAYDLAGNVILQGVDSVPKRERAEQDNQDPRNISSFQKPELKTKSTFNGYNISMIGKPGNNSWYISNVTVFVGGLQGNESVYYSMDNEEWQTYDFPLTLFLDGVHSFTVVVLDQYGTVTLLDPVFIKIDKTPPTATLSEKFKVNWRGIFFIFIDTAHAQDNTSGLDRIEFWAGSTLKYSQSFYYHSGTQTATWYHHRKIKVITVIAYDLAGHFIKNEFNLNST